MAHPRKPPNMRKNLPKISYARRFTAHFVLNFVAMATGVGRGKIQLAAFDGPSPKTPLYAQKTRKNLLPKPSYSQFCPKFRCHGNSGRSGKNAVNSIRRPIPEKLLSVQKSRENLLCKPSYSPFCPKFRCHGNGGRSGKMQLAAFDGTSTKKNPPYRRKNLPKISYTRRVMVNSVPNFVAMATGVDRAKMQLAAFDGASPKTPL